MLLLGIFCSERLLPNGGDPVLGIVAAGSAAVGYGSEITGYPGKIPIAGKIDVVTQAVSKVGRAVERLVRAGDVIELQPNGSGLSIESPAGAARADQRFGAILSNQDRAGLRAEINREGCRLTLQYRAAFGDRGAGTKTGILGLYLAAAINQIAG